MTLLESLLDAIVRLEGDALVMHVGEKPYVVTTSSAMNPYRGPLAWGQVELSSRILTAEAVLSMVGQILPPQERQALDDLGAVEHEIAAPSGVADRFTVVAARGGDDIWLELRRHPALAVPAVEARPAAAAVDTATAIAEAAAVAVGLQEPPTTHREEATTPTVHEAAPEFADRTASPSEETTIEERVPVLDEVSEHPPEHVEHFRIPVNGEGLHEADASSVEIVEPEAQHLPTEEDVDAMLAETAGALLNGDDLSEPRWTDPDAATELILIEQEHDQIAGEPEIVDLSGALDEEVQRSSADIPPADERDEEETIAFQTAVEIERQAVVEDAAPAASEEQTVALSASTMDVQEPTAPTEPEHRSVEELSSLEPRTPIEPEQQQTHSTSAPEPTVQEGFEVPTFHVPASDFELQPSDFELEKGIPVDHTSAFPKSRPEPTHKPVPRETIAAGAHDTTHPGGTVVPLSRTGAKPERPTTGGRVDDEGLLHILRVAAERAASTVYVVAQSRPMVRIDGEISPLEGEPILPANEIERFIAAIAPRKVDAPPDAQVEWISEVPEVGRVRCTSFRDHRGPGLIFRMISAKSISADHLNLSPELRDLCAQADGLVLVTGARGSGKSTLLNSFVDLINRTRSDHVITIETEIGFVHESRRSFISQREVHSDPAAAAAAAHLAVSEDPDVLVIEDLHSPETISAALEAAESGRLVFASITAPSSASAIDALVEMFPAGQRPGVRNLLSRTLRAVVGQVLLRKASGGRVTARELLLNSPAIAASIREGKSSDIPASMESGARHGMISMSEALAALVRGGMVHSAEAYRRAPDRAALLACLAREGVDTSFAEKFA